MASTDQSSTSENGKNELDSQLQCFLGIQKGLEDCNSSCESFRNGSSTTTTFISGGSDVACSKLSSVSTSIGNSKSYSTKSKGTSYSIILGESMRITGETNSEYTCASSPNTSDFHSARHCLLPMTMASRDRLNALRMNDFLCDVTVLCGDHVFPAHQAVLVSASNLFASLIDADRSAKQERQTLFAKEDQSKSQQLSEAVKQRGYDAIPQACPSCDTNVTVSGVSTSVNLGCSEDVDTKLSLESHREPPFSQNSGSDATLPTGRIRGGGEKVTDVSIIVHDNVSVCSPNSNTTRAFMYNEDGEAAKRSIKQNDIVLLQALQQAACNSVSGTNKFEVIGLCSKKELEVTMEHKCIRVKTITSSVSLTPKTLINRMPFHTPDDSSCCTHAQPNGKSTEFTPSPSGTDDSGVCLPEYSTSEPNSHRLVTTSNCLPDLAELLKAACGSVFGGSSETSCDLVSTEYTQDTSSESKNYDSTIPLRKCNSGILLSDRSSPVQKKDFETLSEPVESYMKIALPENSASSHTNESLVANMETGCSLPFVSNDTTIKIHSVDPIIFGVLLDFAYTGSLKKLETLAVERFMEVNAAARKLQMTRVNVLSLKAFNEVMTQRNFVSLWNLADRAQSKPLADAVVEYLAQHLDSVWMSPLLLQLPYQRMIRVILACKTVALKPKPDLVLRTYIAWIKMDPACRCHTIKAVWSIIDKAGITANFAEQLLTEEKIVKSSNELRHALGILSSKPSVSRSPHTDKKLTVKTGSSNHSLALKLNCPSLYSYSLSSSRTRSDNDLCISHRPVAVTLKKGDGATTPKLRFAKIIQPRSTPPPSCATPVKEKLGPPQLLKMMPSGYNPLLKPPKVSSAAINREVTGLSEFWDERRLVQPPLIVIGKSEPLGEVVALKLEQQNGNWFEELIELNVVMEDKQSVHFYDVYVILLGGEKGGFSGKKLHTVSLCDLRTNWIVQLPDMHLARSSAAIFMMGSTLYVSGGKGRYGEDVSEVEALKVSDQDLSWKVKASMKVKRSSHSVVTTDAGVAYAVGGGTRRCERYHPKLRKWTDLPTLPAEFSRFDTVQVSVLNDVVVMIRHRPSEIYVLDEERSLWVQHHVTGIYPSVIVSAASWERNIVAVDDKKMVSTLALGENEWKTVAKITRPHFKPVLIAFLKLNDASKSPPEIKWIRPSSAE